MTKTSHKYPIGTKLIAHDQWEPFPDGVIIGLEPDGRYLIESESRIFTESEGAIEIYYTVERQE